MHAHKHLATILLLGLLATSACLGAETLPGAQLERFAAQAGRNGNAELGRQFFINKHGTEWACASCHGEPPTQAGRHARTGKPLQPLAPAFNPKSFTDQERIDKWFRRNCQDVLGRECQAAEKADVLAWLISLKP